MRHKKKNDIKLGENEVFTGDMYSKHARCPVCGGILATNLGAGISYTFCADCVYGDYDYD